MRTKSRWGNRDEKEREGGMEKNVREKAMYKKSGEGAGRLGEGRDRKKME